MYAKLVLRNARRSIQDYLVYLLTMTICVTLFYPPDYDYLRHPVLLLPLYLQQPLRAGYWDGV